MAIRRGKHGQHVRKVGEPLGCFPGECVVLTHLRPCLRLQLAAYRTQLRDLMGVDFTYGSRHLLVDVRPYARSDPSLQAASGWGTSKQVQTKVGFILSFGQSTCKLVMSASLSDGRASPLL